MKLTDERTAVIKRGRKVLHRFTFVQFTPYGNHTAGYKKALNTYFALVNSDPNDGKGLSFTYEK